MTGRLTKYSDEAYMEVVRLIGEGVPLNEALGGQGKPGRTAFFKKVQASPDLAKAYGLAMEMRAAGRADKLLEINALLLQGKIDPQSAKVASDNYKWLASKEDSRRYGDISRQEITGKDGTSLLPDQPKLSDLELARSIAWIMNKAERSVVNAGSLRALPSEPGS